VADTCFFPLLEGKEEEEVVRMVDLGEGTIAEGVPPLLTLCMIIKYFTLNKIISDAFEN
jgi:hypothetical protein